MNDILIHWMHFSIIKLPLYTLLRVTMNASYLIIYHQMYRYIDAKKTLFDIHILKVSSSILEVISVIHLGDFPGVCCSSEFIMNNIAQKPSYTAETEKTCLKSRTLVM